MLLPKMLFPYKVGIAAPETTKTAKAYRCPATLEYEEVSAFVYTVFVAANKAVSFAHAAARVPPPFAALLYKPIRARVGVAAAAVLPLIVRMLAIVSDLRAVKYVRIMRPDVD